MIFMNIPPRLGRRQLLGAAALLAAGCRPSSAPASRLPEGARVLALGDSLTAGFGALPEQAWPARLAQRSGWVLVNAGLNGDTAAGAQARLGPLLAAQRYDAVLIGIGGNDMLRGVPRARTVAALRALLQAAKAHTPHVGLLATPEPVALRAALGRLADAPFYAEVAREEGVLLLPGLYAEVLSDATLRSDAIHANAAGYERIADALARRLQEAGWR